MDKQNEHPIHTAELGKRLRAARSAKGFSIGSFAAKVELSDRYVSDIERGGKDSQNGNFCQVTQCVGTVRGRSPSG